MKLMKGLVLLFFFCPVIAQVEFGKVEVGHGLPKFTLGKEDGAQLAIDNTLLNKIIVIHFFSLWDENTKQELDYIAKYISEPYQDYANFALIVIGVGNSDEELDDYKEKENIPFNLYPDPLGEVYAQFALGEKLPHTYIADIDNKVVYLDRGFSTENFRRTDEFLRKLLDTTVIHENPWEIYK